MFSDMAYFFLAILCMFLVPTLFITYIGTAVLPFLDTSRQEVRDLFLALKDLALPMESFPSRLLGLRTSEFVPQLFHPSSICQTGEEGIPEITTNATSQETNEGEPHRMRSITTQPHIESAPLDTKCLDSEEDQDESFLDTLEYQPCHTDEIDTSTSGVERDPASEAVEEAAEVFFDTNQANENDPTGTDEDLGSITHDLSRMTTEKETLETYIRQAADPEGSRGLAVMNLDQLVRWIMQKHERETNDLRIHNNRREDEFYDAQEAFEAIIIGQNLAMQEDRQETVLARQEATELRVENSELREAKATYEEREVKWKGRIRAAQRNAEGDRLAADEAIAGVESRINQLKQAHAKEISAAAFQSLQERNTIICSRRMVRDELAKARNQVIALEKQHEATVKENNIEVKGLNASVRH